MNVLSRITSRTVTILLLETKIYSSLQLFSLLFASHGYNTAKYSDFEETSSNTFFPVTAKSLLNFLLELELAGRKHFNRLKNSEDFS